jgi:hypothetical protein
MKPKIDFSVDNKTGLHMVNGDSWEHHWVDEPVKGITLIASCCPANHPWLSVFTMKNKVAQECRVKLRSEGWEGA